MSFFFDFRVYEFSEYEFKVFEFRVECLGFRLRFSKYS